MRIWLFLPSILGLVLAGCQGSFPTVCFEGASEFVIDSYKIRQGKNGILELQGQTVSDLPDEVMVEYEDTINEGDILNIGVYYPSRPDFADTIESLNREVRFQVRSGKIKLPNIPSVSVEGLTLFEAQKRIEEAFGPGFKGVEVFVSYEDRLLNKVDLIGPVEISTIPVDGKMRLFELLSKSRVSLKADFFSSYVVRDGAILPLDLDRLIHEGDMSQNVVMRGGDKILIAEFSRSKAMVMGEVFLPRVIPLPRGYRPLREVIAMAQGIPYTGDKGSIQIIRGSLISPKVYLLKWDEILSLPNDSLLVMPGDMIYVSERPITKWNRFFSQLLPFNQGGQHTTQVVDGLEGL